MSEESRPIIYRKAGELIPISKGGTEPSRFYKRGLIKEEEIPEYKAMGWLIDESVFKMNPDDYPIRP
jgi:hypothetical protein